MLSCNEVLAHHSEYIDDMLPAPRAQQVRLHLEVCDGCARYDRVLRKGVSLLASSATLPSPDFLGTLHDRLAFEEQRTMRPVTMATSASVSIAAVVALAAWIPSLMPQQQPGGVEPQWSIASTELARLTSQPREVRLAQTTADISLISYSPLILEPPTAPPSYSNVTLTSLENR